MYRISAILPIYCKLTPPNTLKLSKIIDQLKPLPPQGQDGRTLPLQGHVGFDSLPDQLVNKCVNLGFDMNILCVGETGIGKSTLMDCLFKANFDGE